MQLSKTMIVIAACLSQIFVVRAVNVAFADDLEGDVIVADLQSVRSYGSEGGISALSIGTTPCNVGTDRIDWIAITNEHPVVAQSAHRLLDNRFEQIGLSWARHGFYAVSGSYCSPCVDVVPYGQQLGIGCSNPSSATLNAVQTNQSPRSAINAHTGFFEFPPQGWPEPDPDSEIERRMQVHDTDLDLALNAGARYFIEGFYITADESSAATRNNSASYREVLVRRSWSSGLFELVINYDWLTQREQPAVRAWQDVDPSVVETDIQIPDEGLFILAAKVIAIEPGLWRYSYALQNLNSDRSGQSFSVPLPQAAVISNVGFHDVDYHSGELYDSTDWPADVTDEAITWSTDDYDVNEDANALRWGTIYNFYFDSNVPPAPSTITLGLFKPGTPDQVQADTIGPRHPYVDCNDNYVADDCDIDCAAPGCVDPCGTSGDTNDNGIPDECEAGIVSMDIRPGTCPNPLNIRSRGVLPTAVLGTETLDVTEIDFTTLTLTRADGVGGAVPPMMKRPGHGTKIEDVGTPFEGELCECHELACDGIDDLLLKFSTEEIVSTLQLGSVPRGTPVELTLIGSTFDGTTFETSDCIVTKGKPRQHHKHQHRIGHNRS